MEEKIQYSGRDLIFSRVNDCECASLSEFSCGVREIDDFIHNEMRLCAKYRYITPYCVKHHISGEILGVFTLSNDSIMLEEDDAEDFPNLSNEYRSIFPLQPSFPAVNIGHLGVRSDLQSAGIGSIIIRYVAHTFTKFNVAGCQFITVDSLNNPRTNGFYSRLGFEYQSLHDQYHSTRRMYLDIFTIRNVIA